jgi:hypothetical protein
LHGDRTEYMGTCQGKYFIIIIIFIIEVIDIFFSIDIMIFKFCTQVLRYIVHTLVGGGGLHEGFNALDYRKIKHWDACKLGNYPILSVLPD